MLFSVILLSCTSNKLSTGQWSGSLTPGNHPEMVTPINYEVTYIKNELVLWIISPDGSRLETRSPKFENGTLTFQFNEPEEGILLDCKLEGGNQNGFMGECKDDSGKSARFDMKKD